jgi:putative membrane protein
MERKLYWGITTPGMILTFIFGIWMLVDYAWASYGQSGWLHAKLGLLALLVLYHIQCGRWLADFKHDRNRRGHVYYRWMNEVPVLFLVGIVLLAVLKPF